MTERTTLALLALMVCLATPAHAGVEVDRRMVAVDVQELAPDLHRIRAHIVVDPSGLQTNTDLSCDIIFFVNGVAEHVLQRSLTGNPPGAGPCGLCGFTNPCICDDDDPDDCQCGAFSFTAVCDTQLTPGAFIDVQVLPAPGALQDTDFSNNTHQMTWHGADIFWNRRLHDVEIIPPLDYSEYVGGIYCVIVTWSVDANYEGPMDPSAVGGLRSDGELVQAIPSPTGSMTWSQCADGCGFGCAEQNGVPTADCGLMLDQTCHCPWNGIGFVQFDDVELTGALIEVELTPDGFAVGELPERVADDTHVVAAPLIANGLTVLPLGLASIAETSTGLEITGVPRADGVDGVRIPVGYAAGVGYRFGPDELGPGDVIETTRTYRNEQGDVVALSSIRAENTGNGLEVAADFGGPRDVEVYLGDILVASVLDHVYAWDVRTTAGQQLRDCRHGAGDDTVLTFVLTDIISLPDGTQVVGDRVRLSPGGEDEPIDALQTVDIGHRNNPLDENSSHLFADYFTVLPSADARGSGGARLWSSSNRLVVQNIGATGDHGVDVSFDAASAIEVDVSGVELPAISDTLRSVATATQSAGSSAQIYATLKQAGGGIELSANLAGIGATTLRVQALAGGQVVADLSGVPMSAPFATVDGMPGCDIWDFMGNGVAEHRSTWRTPVGALIDGQQLTVDEIVVTPEDGMPVDIAYAASYIATGLDEFELGDIVVHPVSPCPTDLDFDGTTGVSDLLALIGAWGPCAGCPEDVDGDGVVGIGDVLMFLAAWGPCE